MREPAGRLLVIDTSGTSGSVAMADLDRGCELIADESLPGRSASERLVPTVRELISRTGTDLRRLAAVAVIDGPGSFTGVRVGLSAAKGLCEALRVPLIGISRLAVLASHVADQDCLAVLDAGRGELYVGHYKGAVCRREHLQTRAEVLATLAANSDVVAVVCESGVAEVLAGHGPVLVSEPMAPDAVPLACRRLTAREFDEIANLNANYLRRSDLEIFAKSPRLIGKRG